MNEQFAYFLGCVISIVGMLFALVVGYYIGYNDAKQGRGFNRE